MRHAVKLRQHGRDAGWPHFGELGEGAAERIRIAAGDGARQAFGELFLRLGLLGAPGHQRRSQGESGEALHERRGRLCGDSGQRVRAQRPGAACNCPGKAIAAIRMAQALRDGDQQGTRRREPRFADAPEQPVAFLEGPWLAQARLQARHKLALAALLRWGGPGCNGGSVPAVHAAVAVIELGDDDTIEKLVCRLAGDGSGGFRPLLQRLAAPSEAEIHQVAGGGVRRFGVHKIDLIDFVRSPFLEP